MRRAWIWLSALLFSAMAMLSTQATAQPHLTQSQIEQFNALFTDGGNVVAPYLILTGRAEAPLNAAEVRRGIALLDQAIAIYPDHWQTWWVRGKAFQALGEGDGWLGSLRRAYELAPREQPVLNELTIAAIEMDQFEFALEAVRRGLRYHPNDLALRARLALALLMTGDPRGAVEAADQALELAPDDGITLTIRRIAVEVRDGARPQPRTMAQLYARQSD